MEQIGRLRHCNPRRRPAAESMNVFAIVKLNAWNNIMAMTRITLALYPLLLLGTYQTAHAQTAWGVVKHVSDWRPGRVDYLTPILNPSTI